MAFGYCVTQQRLDEHVFANVKLFYCQMRNFTGKAVIAGNEMCVSQSLLNNAIRNECCLVTAILT